jgi:hypothetical protein
MKQKTANRLFDICANWLIRWADRLGITYEAINVWIFLVIWPIFTIILMVYAVIKILE